MSPVEQQNVWPTSMELGHAYLLDGAVSAERHDPATYDFPPRLGDSPEPSGRSADDLSTPSPVEFAILPELTTIARLKEHRVPLLSYLGSVYPSTLQAAAMPTLMTPVLSH